MSTLFLDLASHESLIALVDENRTLASTIVNGKDESALMPSIESLSKKNGGTVDRIAVIIGPGGFMSLRVGISLANTLSWARKIPIAGVHQSDLWSLRAERSSAQNFVWLHSTKRDALFVRGFGECEKIWPEATLITIAELKHKLRVAMPQSPGPGTPATEEIQSAAAIRKSSRSTVEDAAPQHFSRAGLLRGEKEGRGIRISYIGELIPEHEAALPIQRIESMASVPEVLPSLIEHLDFKNTPVLPWYGRTPY